MKQLCGQYIGDNDGTCPQLTCIRDLNHSGLCDNVRDDGEDEQAARPEYVHCVLTGMYIDGTDQREQTTWCGRTVYREFVFQDPTHAILNGHHKNYLLCCPECSKAMMLALQEGTWEP